VNAVAVKFQKHHPSSMSLDGFDAKFLTPGAFREMLKRTFNVSVTNKELGALVDFFFYEDDKDMNKVELLCKCADMCLTCQIALGRLQEISALLCESWF
jgi:hypothetical protein